MLRGLGFGFKVCMWDSCPTPAVQEVWIGHRLKTPPELLQAKDPRLDLQGADLAIGVDYYSRYSCTRAQEMTA